MNKLDIVKIKPKKLLKQIIFKQVMKKNKNTLHNKRG